MQHWGLRSDAWHLNSLAFSEAGRCFPQQPTHSVRVLHALLACRCPHLLSFLRAVRAFSADIFLHFLGTMFVCWFIIDLWHYLWIWYLVGFLKYAPSSSLVQFIVLMLCSIFPAFVELLVLVRRRIVNPVY